MQQVTDKPATLEELKRKMSSLISARNAAIDAAEAMIDTANREFDRVALPLGREINKVRKAVEATKPKPSAVRTRETRVKVLEGLDDDEQDYYQQLKKRKGKS